MNYLGIDYGEKRVGLAKADGDNKIAVPFGTMTNDAEIFDGIARVVKNEEIGLIVVGLPISFDGRENNFAKKIREFGSRVSQAVDRPVEFENEIFSSKIEPEKAQKIDESSAALILQSFIDQIK